jgi:anti-sigma factor RsiW
MPEQPPLNDDERAELIAYLDGELELTDAEAVERKLNGDPRIRAEADALRRTFNLLEFLPKPEPSPNFTNQTLDRVNPVRKSTSLRLIASRPRRWMKRVGWAAAILLAGVIGYGGAPWVEARFWPAAQPVSEAEQMARDLRVLEQLGLYQHVPDNQFLNELDRPELFGDE